jgi:hypothetical protein
LGAEVLRNFVALEEQMQLFKATTKDHVLLLTLQRWPQSSLEQLL